MPQARVPFLPDQRSGEERLAGGMPSAHNVVVDATGSVRRRPGIQAHSAAPSSPIDSAGINGVYETTGGALYAVSADTGLRSIYAVNASSYVDLRSQGGTADLRGGRRPTFAETDALLVVAAGADLQRIELDGKDCARLGGGPPRASHVITNASRLLVNHVDDEFPGRISFSGTAFASDVYDGHEQWSLGVGTAGFFTAEARPDPVLALHENTNEVFAFGSRTLQVFQPDGRSVYSPLPTIEYGISAPYSVIKRDQSFAWLDDRRRFVMSDGRGGKVISQAIQQDLDDMTTVSDAFGYRVHLGPVDALVWTFPSDGRTFVYQVGGGWSQWHGWDGNLSRFKVNAHTQALSGAKNLVGTTDGYIGELSMDAATDLGDTIVSRVTTGFIDRGTNKRKHCQSLRLVLQRGKHSAANPPEMLVRYRDGLGAFSPPHVVDLGRSGDFEVTVELRSLGVYRRREWMFEFSSEEEFVLAEAVEEFEELET